MVDIQITDDEPAVTVQEPHRDCKVPALDSPDIPLTQQFEVIAESIEQSVELI